MTITPDTSSRIAIPAQWRPERSPGAVLARLAAHRLELLERVRYDEHRRWHARLTPAEAGTSEVEVWLLSWLPGQVSPLHDHGGSSGAFTVLTGALDEGVVSATSGRSSEHLWTRGPVRAFGSHHVHEVGNDGDVPAVSLHAYAPELGSMTRYRRTGSGLEARSVEVAGSDW